MAERNGTRSSTGSMEMALRGRIGGYARAAKYSPEELTCQARAGFLRRFEIEVDPDGTLPPEERSRRGVADRKAHMAVLAHKSAKARRRRSQRLKSGSLLPHTSAAEEAENKERGGTGEEVIGVPNHHGS